MAARKCVCCRKNKAITRKVCLSCRDDAKALIDAGLSTDADLVAAGLLAPKKPLGRPRHKKQKIDAKPLEENLMWQRLQELSVGAR